MTSISVRWMNLDTPMKHQMKHHQVFIWDETCFSSEIKHLHFNEINFLLFHLRRHVKNSGFVLYHGFQIPRNRWKHSACGLVLSSVSRYLEPVIKHSPSFLIYYMKQARRDEFPLTFTLSMKAAAHTDILLKLKLTWTSKRTCCS